MIDGLQRKVRTRRLRSIVALGVTACALAVSAAPVGAAAPPPFKIVFTDTYSAPSWFGPSVGTVLVVGDSLTAWGDGPGAQAIAESIRTATWLNVYVAAASGSSVPNWTQAGWLQGANGGDIASLGALEDYLKPVMTVIALGSNDARLMKENSGSYDAIAHRASLLKAVKLAQKYSRCGVLITNVAGYLDWPWAGYKKWAVSQANNDVNFVIAELDQKLNPKKRVFLADWALWASTLNLTSGGDLKDDMVHFKPGRGQDLYKQKLTDYVRFYQVANNCS